MTRLWTMAAVLLASAALLAPVAGADQPITALAPFDTILDGRNELVGVAVTPDGIRYISDRGAGLVYRIDASGALSVAASNLDRPAGLALDGQGRLLIVEEQAGQIRRLHAGALTIIATGLKTPRWITAASDGAFYVSAHRLTNPDGGDTGEGREIIRLAADGTLTMVATGIHHVEGLTRLNGHLIAATRGLASGSASAGTLLRYPVLADGSLGTPLAWVTTGLKQPMGLVFDALAAIYVSSKELTLTEDSAKRAIGKVHPDAQVTDFGANFSDPQGVALGPDGALYLADGHAGRLLRFVPPAAPTLDPLAAATNQPTVTVTGTTVAGARVDLFVNESTTSTTVVAGTTGAFSASVTLSENDDNDLQVFATTHAGNGLASSPTSAVIAHDSVAPSLTFQAPPAGTHVRQTITVTAQASDADGAIASLTLRAAGQPLSATVTPAPPAPSVTASASWDTTLTADGAQTLAADAIDHAGNTQSATRAVIVDNTPPDTTIAGGPSGDTQEPSATFTFTGSDNLTPAGSSLAKSSDGSLRVVAAATAALRRFPEGSDPAKADVVRPLIDGLSHDSVSVRSAASLGLRQALDGIGGGICFGATDSLDRRAAAIRQWEEWWNRNRKELARDRVVQRFW